MFLAIFWTTISNKINSRRLFVYQNLQMTSLMAKQEFEDRKQPDSFVILFCGEKTASPSSLHEALKMSVIQPRDVSPDTSLHHTWDHTGTVFTNHRKQHAFIQISKLYSRLSSGYYSVHGSRHVALLFSSSLVSEQYVLPAALMQPVPSCGRDVALQVCVWTLIHWWGLN